VEKRHRRKEPKELWSSLWPDGQRREDLKEEVVCIFRNISCIVLNTTVFVSLIYFVGR
jgi:hypothetical protein